MEDDKTHLNNEWYNNVSAFMNGKTDNSNFIGHCCEVETKIRETMNKSAGLLSTQDKVSIDSEDHRVIKAGMLHFPQLHILLDSPMVEYVDVHGIGKENSSNHKQKPGLLHAVVHEDCILKKKKEKCKLHYEREEEINFIDVHGEERMLKTVIQCYIVDGKANLSQMAHHPPSKTNLKYSKVLSQPDKFDVWIVLAITKKDSCHAHLVNARWKSNLGERWKDESLKKSFFKDLLRHIRHNGLEVSRRGGSSGKTTYANSNILKLLKTNSAFPRKGKGIKVVKKDTTWKCYYLASKRKHNQVRYDRSFKSFEYTQPVIGGQLELSSHLLEEYEDVVSSMTTAKYNTAILMSHLNTIMTVYIQTEAVNQAIIQINQCRAYQRWMELNHPALFIFEVTKKQHLINMLSLENKYSVVAYPVCYHYDIFKEQSPSLENKICFSFKADSYQNIGRGGDGPGQFVFAFLDWQNEASGQRRRRFIGGGGDIGCNERLTLDQWVALFGFHWNDDYTPEELNDVAAQREADAFQPRSPEY